MIWFDNIQALGQCPPYEMPSMERVLEPEVMDTWEDAVEYDAMDFTDVNTAFANEAIALGPTAGLLLDVGTGTARIPILICQQRPWQIRAIDLSQNMLKVGTQNITRAWLSTQIKLELADAKSMPYADNEFDLVISNSIVHHLPDPMPCFREINRVLKPNGALLLRDLIRPTDNATVEALVSRIGPEYNPYQAKLFGDSLRAAFTVDEIRDMITAAGFTGVEVYQSSDRHWTAKRPYRLA